MHMHRKPLKSYLAGRLRRLEDIIRLQDLLIVVFEREAEMVFGSGEAHTMGDLIPTPVLRDHLRTA